MLIEENTKRNAPYRPADLEAAIEAGITVADEIYRNGIGVAEHDVMQILVLARNFISAHSWVTQGGWNIADSQCRDVFVADQAKFLF